MKTFLINNAEIKLTFFSSPGPGGQNVNKVATAVLLRFNVAESPSLSEEVRSQIMITLGNKITKQGDILIKATRFRTQERNKQDAIERLQKLLQFAAQSPKKRKKTQPTFSAKQRRLTTKKLHGVTKSLRSRRPGNDE